MSMNFPMDSSVQHQYYVVPTASFPPYQHQQQQHQQHPSHHHHHNTHQQHAQGSQMVPPYGVHPSGSHFGAPPTGLHQPTTIYELPPSLTGNYQVHPVPLALLSPPMGPSMPPQSYLPAPTYHAPSYAQDIVYQSSSQGVTPHHQHHHNQPPPPHYHLPPNMTTTASTIHLGRPSGPLLPANSAAGVCEGVPSLPVINHTPPQHPALVDKALEPTPADMPPPVRALSFASCRQQRSMKRLEIPPPLPGDTEGPRQLIVNYLSLDIGSAELYDLFTPYGEVEMARVATDTATGRSIGYGFVFMKRYLDAMQAVEHASGRVLLGKRVRVSFAVPQRPVHEATHRHGAVFGPSSLSNATKMEALPRQ